MFNLPEMLAFSFPKTFTKTYMKEMERIARIFLKMEKLRRIFKNAWNAWKYDLLNDLYHEIFMVLAGIKTQILLKLFQYQIHYRFVLFVSQKKIKNGETEHYSVDMHSGHDGARCSRYKLFLACNFSTTLLI